MIISSLLIRNFRLLSEISLSLEEGIHLFLGLNAQGKTSLIEALLFLSTSTSHRTRKEEELIRWGETVSYIRGQVEQDKNNQVIIECGLEKKRKIVKIDGNVLPRIRDLYGHLRTVLFVPEDIAIVDGSPQERRRFLDMAIAQMEPSYITILQQYHRIVDHRNHLLKELQIQSTASLKQQLDVWDASFVEFAVQVIFQRAAVIRQLSPFMDEAYSALADDGPLQITYPAGKDADETQLAGKFREKMERIRHIEIERGSSQIGPHRDDIQFFLADKNLALFGSQGQRRSSVLALRLAQAKLFYEIGYGSPVLLIDDAVYEMDNNRRARFWKYLDFSSQMIATATDRDHLGPGINPTKIFKVENGQIYLY